MFPIVGVSFIIILPMMRWVMQKTILKVINLLGVRHWKCALDREVVKIHLIEMGKGVVQ